MVVLRCNFFRASFLHVIKDTESMKGQAAQIFEVKTLLNNAFKSTDFMTSSINVFHTGAKQNRNLFSS